MSRIGRKIVALPSGVTVELRAPKDGNSGVTVLVKGAKGELTYTALPGITVALEGSAVRVNRTSDADKTRAAHGLARAIVANMVKGVHEGFSKQLEIIGVGFKAQLKGKTLQLQLGFSHPVDFTIPAGIEITQDEKNKNLITVKGIDKQLVGQTAAQIRELRPPEPYKGKGIRYVGEAVRRKVGKAAVAKTAA
jgi:large subunit ribosomal protein L6